MAVFRTVWLWMALGLLIVSQSYAASKSYIIRFSLDLSDQVSPVLLPSFSAGSLPYALNQLTKKSRRLGDKRTAVLSLTDHELKRLYSTGRIVEIEPDLPVKALFDPDDPGFVKGLQYGLSRINAPAAWGYGQGRKSVVIGVIDTGIDLSHPDLIDNIWVNPKETINGLDDDGNGFIDDVNGWDFNSDDSDPSDDNIHGTHVAGVIGAKGNNGRGIAGLNFEVSLIALKALDATGSGTVSSVVNAINYAVALKDSGVADVTALNLSLGGGQSRALAKAVARAESRLIFVVSAAGNDGLDIDQSPSYPASLRNTNVVSVAATDSNNRLSTFSNYGKEAVDLAAPGEEIVSTIPQNYPGAPTPYAYLSGTSMATPHVSGVIALMKSLNQDLSMTQIRGLLLGSGSAVSALNGKTVTGKLLNAEAAVLGALSAENRATISGTVGLGRRVVPEATVIIKGPNGISRRVFTSDDGHFTVDNLPTGNYRATVKKKGYSFKVRSLNVDIPRPSTQLLRFSGRLIST